MKSVALLSGGFDSPVAIHLLQDKLEIIAIHFHQIPLTDEKEIEKVKTLAKHLKLKKLYLIPAADMFKEIIVRCNDRYYFILSKILMLKASEVIAHEENASYLITGENLAQVSSQTMSNLVSITKPIKLPILRPVLTWDKQEILDKAELIGTYEISKGPELCSLLGPKHPLTKSKFEKVLEELNKLNYDELIENALSKKEIVLN
jgi:thiamine biosynthesis protein ThiI